MAEQSCRICGNTEGNMSHFPTEMMFGWGGRFEYTECAKCGCLQIARIPEDLARYYPGDDYYSYKAPRRKRSPGWLLKLRRERTRWYLGELSLAGALLGLVSKRPGYFDWLRLARMRLDSRILDVGCGAGSLLLRLQREGFRFLLGADPMIKADIDYGNGVRVLKRDVHELQGRYDLVMLHHSFEHMPEPAAVLNSLTPLVAPGGTLLVRIPVSDSLARRRYGTNWMAWDAPRHLYLHTVKSIELLAGACGLTVSRVTYDSTGQQFSSSELYLRGIPYVEHGRYRPGHGPGAFSRKEWSQFDAMAKEVNRQAQGDNACFYLTPVR